MKKLQDHKKLPDTKRFKKQDYQDLEQLTTIAKPSAAPLSQEVPEEFRDALPNELPHEPQDTTVNWSQEQDRSEDLAEHRDPFTQQPELDTEIPPELVQRRAYQLFEQRGGSPDGDLADWFEAERQVRTEKKWQRQ